MLPKAWATRRKHVADMKDRFGTTVCPKCGYALVLCGVLMSVAVVDQPEMAYKLADSIPRTHVHRMR